MPVSPDPNDPYAPVYFNNYTFSVSQSSYGQIQGVNSTARSYQPEGFQTATVNGEVISRYSEDVTITSAEYSGALTYQGQTVGTDNDYVYYFNTSTNLGIAITYGSIPQSLTYYSQTGGYAKPDPVCFCSGTSIRTTRGDVAIEDLRKTDIAITASGALRPIRWIGSRTIACTEYDDPDKAWPIRVHAGAFADNVPERDLYLSPGHAVVPPGERLLIPIGHLVDGRNITRDPRVSVTYWHVELDRHDILLAEGLAAESFIDAGIGDRDWFADGTASRRGNETAESRSTPTCMPYFTDWEIVESTKAMLKSRPCALPVSTRGSGRSETQVATAESRFAASLSELVGANCNAVDVVLRPADGVLDEMALLVAHAIEANGRRSRRRPGMTK